jgi:hypothetical protein
MNTRITLSAIGITSYLSLPLLAFAAPISTPKPVSTSVFCQNSAQRITTWQTRFSSDTATRKKTETAKTQSVHQLAQMKTKSWQLIAQDGTLKEVNSLQNFPVNILPRPKLTP